MPLSKNSVVTVCFCFKGGIFVTTLRTEGNLENLVLYKNRFISAFCLELTIGNDLRKNVFFEEEFVINFFFIVWNHRKIELYTVKSRVEFNLVLYTVTTD